MSKFKKYGFWIALTGAVLVVADLLGRKFGFIVDESYITELVTASLGVLVLLGVISKDKDDTTNTDVDDSNDSDIEDKK